MPAFAKNRTLEQSYVPKKTPLAFVCLLTPLVLAAINSLLSTALADGGVAAIVPVLQTTFTNPTPAVSDTFASAVATLGHDLVIVGAPNDDAGETNAGAAYLFRADATLQTTFTNPTPAIDDQFGFSVAGVAGDRVLVGARQDDTGTPDAGAAYLFTTNGTLLMTFTNPVPAAGDFFAHSVAAVGSDCVLIGAVGNDTGAPDAGAAYLFSTNGMLLTVFTNPAPTAGDWFGSSLAALGSDRVVIGAYLADRLGLDRGVAYLFSTNGVLLATFYNYGSGGILGAGQDQFARSVAAVGIDKVLIGAPLAISPNTIFTDQGAAYLYDTNGLLLARIQNPRSGNGHFGRSVAVTGNGLLIISAQSSGLFGEVHVFSPNGNLLSTIVPTGVFFGVEIGRMGNAVTALGNNRVIADWVNAQAAYLYELIPSVSLQRTPTNSLAVSWSSFAPDFALQQNTNGFATGNWSNVTDTIQDDGTNKYIIADPATGNGFYRLIKP